MRIALIAPPWLPVPPPAYGGTESVLHALAVGLEQRGHDVVLVTTGDSAPAVPALAATERAVGVDAMAPPWEVAHVLRAYDDPRVRTADVIHDHTIVGPAGIAPEVDAPVLTTSHGPFAGPCVPVFRAAARHARVIAISHHQAAVGRSLGIAIAAVIHHGIDVDGVPAGDGAGGYAALLARMHPTKGIARACRIARAAGVPLRIAAKMHEPAERAYFEREVEPLLGDGIEYVGEVGAAAKAALLAGASCLLNPIAWDEPFGLAMIEALAAGTPVVATPRGAAPEIVRDGVTGFLREDDAALVHALRAAAGLDRAACRHDCALRFGLDRMVDDHVRLYARVAAAGLVPGRDAA